MALAGFARKVSEKFTKQTLNEHQQQLQAYKQVFEIVGTSSLETVLGDNKVIVGWSFGREGPESPNSLPLRSPGLQQHWHGDAAKIVHAQLKMNASNLGRMECSFRSRVNTF